MPRWYGALSKLIGPGIALPTGILIFFSAQSLGKISGGGTK